MVSCGFVWFRAAGSKISKKCVQKIKSFFSKFHHFSYFCIQNVRITWKKWRCFFHLFLSLCHHVLIIISSCFCYFQKNVSFSAVIFFWNIFKIHFQAKHFISYRENMQFSLRKRTFSLCVHAVNTRWWHGSRTVSWFWRFYFSRHRRDIFRKSGISKFATERVPFLKMDVLLSFSYSASQNLANLRQNCARRRFVFSSRLQSL